MNWLDSFRLKVELFIFSNVNNNCSPLKWHTRWFMNKSLHNQIAMVSIMTCETVNNWIVTVSCPYFHITDTPFPRNIHMLNRIMVLILMPFIPDTTINWNLWHLPVFFPGSFPSIWTLKDYFVEIPAPGQILCSNAPTNFLKR